MQSTWTSTEKQWLTIPHLRPPPMPDVYTHLTSMTQRNTIDSDPIISYALRLMEKYLTPSIRTLIFAKTKKDFSG